MQAAPGDPRSEVLGFASMGGDPRQDGRGVGALREDCGTLDDLAAGGVRSRQARDQGANRVVVHGSEASRPARESTRLPGRRRATGLPGHASLTPAVSKPVAARARPLRARLDHPHDEQKHRRLGRDLRRHHRRRRHPSTGSCTTPPSCRSTVTATACAATARDSPPSEPASTTPHRVGNSRDHNWGILAIVDSIPGLTDWGNDGGRHDSGSCEPGTASYRQIATAQGSTLRTPHARPVR